MGVLFFVDRSREADEYPWLAWKVRFFIVGAGLAVGGMVMEMNWLILVAVGVLVAGFLLRYLPGGKGRTLEQEADEDPDEGNAGRLQ